MSNEDDQPPKIGDPYAVPRNERLEDWAALGLGLEPYRWWHRYHEFRDLPQGDFSERMLRDAPVFLKNYLDDYSVERYAATLEEVIERFQSFPASSAEEVMI